MVNYNTLGDIKKLLIDKLAHNKSLVAAKIFSLDVEQRMKIKLARNHQSFYSPKINHRTYDTFNSFTVHHRLPLQPCTIFILFFAVAVHAVLN